MHEGDSIKTSRRRRRSRRRVRRIPLDVFFDRYAISAYIAVAAILALIWRVSDTPNITSHTSVLMDQSIAVLDDLHSRKSLNDLRNELLTAATDTEGHKVDPIQVKLLEVKLQKMLILMEERAARRNLGSLQAHN